MKREIFKLGESASLNNLLKLALLFTLIFSLEFFTTINADAQRREFRTGHVSYNRPEHIERFNRGDNDDNEFPSVSYSFYPWWETYNWYLPYTSFDFMYGGLDYYLHNGICYQYNDGRYNMVPAPVGSHVRRLPKGHEELSVGGATYYYYYGAFYKPIGKKYKVVPAPVGAIVGNIPKGANKLKVDGQTFYSANGVQYKAILKDNAVWYQVVKNQDNASRSSAQPQKEQSTPNKV